MANDTSTISVNMAFVPAGGGASAISPISVLAAYQAMSSGKLDIPAATAAATQLLIPFGGIAKATALLILNTNESEVGIRINAAVGGADEFDLPSGGVLLIASADAPDAVEITTAAIATTAEQVAAGQVSYWVFGDPV